MERPSHLQCYVLGCLFPQRAFRQLACTHKHTPTGAAPHVRQDQVPWPLRHALPPPFIGARAGERMNEVIMLKQIKSHIRHFICLSFKHNRTFVQNLTRTHTTGPPCRHHAHVVCCGLNKPAGRKWGRATAIIFVCWRGGGGHIFVQAGARCVLCCVCFSSLLQNCVLLVLIRSLSLALQERAQKATAPTWHTLLCSSHSYVLVAVSLAHTAMFSYIIAGACPKSYGTNVARLAGLPDAVVTRAAHMSATTVSEPGAI